MTASLITKAEDTLRQEIRREAHVRRYPRDTASPSPSQSDQDSIRHLEEEIATKVDLHIHYHLIGKFISPLIGQSESKAAPQTPAKPLHNSAQCSTKPKSEAQAGCNLGSGLSQSKKTDTVSKDFASEDFTSKDSACFWITPSSTVRSLRLRASNYADLESRL